jgi:hypothetical protein
MAQITPIELPVPGVASTGGGEVYFIGNATTLITYAGFTLLTDPAFLHKGDYTPLGHGASIRGARSNRLALPRTFRHST